ncbi:MAG: nuclear transport factor 2 family protein [Acidimicrobiia bacterium]
MGDWDQSVTWQDLEARLEATANPRHRQMLQVVIDHGKAEAVGDVEALIASLSADPQYRFWSQGRDVGPKGRDAIRAFYDDFVASGSGFFESRKLRIVVDDDTIVTENAMRAIVPGAVARARGYAIDDLEGHYLVANRTVILWVFDESCALVGEDSYASSDITDIQRVPDDELPDEYLAMLDVIKEPSRRSRSGPH